MMLNCRSENYRLLERYPENVLGLQKVTVKFLLSKNQKQVRDDTTNIVVVVVSLFCENIHFISVVGYIH